MINKRKLLLAIALATFATLGGTALALSAQDKYTLKVPNGLAFSEFNGYENWQVVSVSEDGGLYAATWQYPLGRV